MTKPIVHLDDLEFADHAHGESFEAKLGPIGRRLGAEKLGVRLVVVPPGKKAWPYHNHHANEELFVVLGGEGTLRYGREEHPVRTGDVIVTPAGGRETAHQLLNTSQRELRYLAISTMLEPDVIEYPDSEKFAAIAGAPPGALRHERRFNVMAKLAAKTDYWTDES